MRIRFVILISLLVHSTIYAQVDERTVVGVAKFTCDENAKYASLVTENLVEVLTNTKRFNIVDRTSYDKVKEELELQKSEAFMDSQNLVEQDIAVAAEKIVTGHISKIPVYAVKNTNGSVKGYKASVAFQLKIVDVALGLSTEAAGFDGKSSDLMLSPESAVTQAMASLKGDLENYFRINFPVTGKVTKVLETKKDAAQTVLLNIGVKQGIKAGDKLIVEFMESIDGKPYPNEIGEITVKALKGEFFAECTVEKKAGTELLARFSAGEVLTCKLVVK